MCFFSPRKSIHNTYLNNVTVGKKKEKTSYEVRFCLDSLVGVLMIDGWLHSCHPLIMIFDEFFFWAKRRLGIFFFFFSFGNSSQKCGMTLRGMVRSSTYRPSPGFVICWPISLYGIYFIVLVILHWVVYSFRKRENLITSTCITFRLGIYWGY